MLGWLLGREQRGVVDSAGVRVLSARPSRVSRVAQQLKEEWVFAAWSVDDFLIDLPARDPPSSALSRSGPPPVKL